MCRLRSASAIRSAHIFDENAFGHGRTGGELRDAYKRFSSTAVRHRGEYNAHRCSVSIFDGRLRTAAAIFFFKHAFFDPIGRFIGLLRRLVWIVRLLRLVGRWFELQHAERW